ncbi:ribosome recycling factor [candidate division WOR-3 bacterium]|nr:ribosome recycling factor [candidate division WOR-3 bacterium]MCK4527388.1 ribosome recycling factor [candidate division WOR-3 bacterium]
MDKEFKKEIIEKMEKTASIVADEFAAVKTGRASPSLIKDIKVDYYGAKTPLNQIASITTPEPHLIVVHPYDGKAIDSIMKALQASKLGLNPSSDGTVLRIPIPPLTDERREELVGLIRRLTEEGRVSLRNIRRDTMKRIQAMEKEGELSEDEAMRYKDRIQEFTDHFTRKLDELLLKKEEEILNG